MFTVIGTDGKEYGPVNEEQLRLWLAQGRLNAQSKVKFEGTQQWKNMGDLPQFRTAAAPPIPPLAPPSGSAPVISGLAIASLVLGVLGIVTLGLTGIPGLILGIIALRQINRSPGRLGGTGMAIAGMCVSGVMLLFLPIMAAMLLPALAKAKSKAQSVQCMNHVKQLNLALIMYADDNNGTLPPADKWCDLIKPYTGNSEIVYHCAAQPQGRCSYAFNASLGHRQTQEITAPARMVLIFSSEEGWNQSGGVQSVKAHSHSRGSPTLGFADGHTEIQGPNRSTSLQWEPAPIPGK
jgi:hypothetical protein